MAASSSADAQGSTPAERLRLVRPLGARGVPTWAAIDTLTTGKTRLLVVERVTRGGDYGDQEIADWIRDANRVATLEHPNIARVREVVIRGEEVLVVGDYVDGVRLSELLAKEPRPTLETALRVLVDVLTGLGALHNLRDAKQEPLGLVHGELTPDCVVVGLDGVARLVSPCRVRSATPRAGRDGSGYLAPELLLGDESADCRADVYAVGVMLWEVLSGRPLFSNVQPSAIVTHLLSGRVPRATAPAGSPWAAPLVDLVARTLSADPQKRFATAAAMAAEIRRIAGTRLAPQIRVAAYLRGAYGDAIRARREAIERGETKAPAEPVDFDVDVRVSMPTPVPPPTATTRPPPPLDTGETPIFVQVPRAPAAPAIETVTAPLPAPAAPVAPPSEPADIEPIEPEPVVAPPPPLQLPTLEFALSPAPAPPLRETPISTELYAVLPPRRRGPLVLVIGALIVLLGAVVFWFALRPTERVDAAPPPSAPRPPVPLVATAPPVPPPPSAVPSAALSVTLPSAEPPTASVAPAPSAPPATVAPSLPYVPAAPQPNIPPRPPPKPKYDPEGI